MGDVIGRGFDKYVREQVIKRQEKLKYGQTDADVIRWNNANNAFLRLSSGVNVSETFVKNNLELSSNVYKGNLLAKHFKLFAAQTYDSASGKYNFTKGVGYNFNSSYGFTSPEYTSYGLVPPPGITSATIKSLNRGSLREATVNIKCHNLQQFQIIEALYLRLKYSLLLEWGHSMYFNNDGELTQSTHDLSDLFLNGGINQTLILERIQTEREASDGNYDAFFGLVTNFDWTINPDGGYDINMIARAAGDVIESLKINSNAPSNKAIPSGTAKTNLETDAYKSTLNRLLWTIAENVNEAVGRTYAHGLDDKSGKFRVNNDALSTYSGIKASYTKTGGNLLTWNEASMYNFDSLTPGWMGNRQSYIKLGTLLRIIESFLIFYDVNHSNDPIIKIDYNYDSNFCFTFPKHASIDPRICLIPYPTSVSTTQLAAGKLYYDQETINITKVYYPSSNPKSKNQADNQTLISSFATLYPGLQTIDVNGSLINIAKNSSKITLEEYKGTLSADGTTAAIYALKPSTSIPVSYFPPAYANTAGIIADLRSGTDNNKTNIISDQLKTIANSWGNNANLESKDAIFNDEYITWLKVTEESKILVLEENYVTDANGVTPQTPIVNSYIQSASVATPIPTGTISEFGVRKGLFVTITPINIETLTVAVQKFTNSNASGVFTSSTGATVYKDLEGDNKPGFKDLSDTKNYAGRTMDIRVNMEHIAKTLSDSIDDKDGNANLYTFLKKLLSGIQNALGNVNNFEIIYSEDTNTFRIIDNTLIPGRFKKLNSEQQKIVEFLITADGDKGVNGGSFVHNINFRTKLSNAFATMATVGAQANGATVGEDATALSRWNVGLTDRIISKRIGSGPEVTESTNVDTEYINNIAAFQNLINKTNDTTLSDAEISQAKNAATDIFKTEIAAFSLKGQNDPKKGITPLGFIPFDLELNMMGLSGPRIYESYTIDTRLLPKSYQDSIQFICSGISHTITNGEWKTTLNSICGPKQEGAEVEGMPATTPATAATPPRQSTPSAPLDLSGTDIQPLLSVIVTGESGGRYNAFFGNESFSSIAGKEMTASTIAEVSAISEKSYSFMSNGVTKTVTKRAVGKYQIVDLLSVSTKAGLLPTDLFNEANQDKLGEYFVFDARKEISNYVQAKNSGTKEDLERAVTDLGQCWTSKPTIINVKGTIQGYVDVDGDASGRKGWAVSGINSDEKKINVSQVVRALIKSRIQRNPSSPQPYIPSYLTWPF
jgi:hypothetical protein